VRVTLHVESDCPDTDFVAKLIEVTPEGRAMLLMDGVTRAMYRDPSVGPQPMALGQVCRVTIALGDIHHTFRAGSRIEIDVTSSNFPPVPATPIAATPCWRAIARPTSALLRTQSSMCRRRHPLSNYQCSAASNKRENALPTCYNRRRLARSGGWCSALLEPDLVSVSWNVAKSGDADLAAAQLAAEVPGQRGFRIVPRGVARAFGVLVVGGTDPDQYAQAKEAGRLNEIPTNHSSALCAGYPSDLAHPRRVPGRRGARLAGTIGRPIGPVGNCRPAGRSA